MCGIISIVRRHDGARDPELAGLVAALRSSVAAVEAEPDAVEELSAVAGRLDAALRPARGLRTVIGDPGLRSELRAAIDALEATAEAMETTLVEQAEGPSDLERRSAVLIALKDVAWALGRDRLPTLEAVEALVGTHGAATCLTAALSIQETLSALDRLEVRGRDSAGISVIVSGHSLGDVTSAASARLGDLLLRSGSVRADGDQLVFVYKAAAEIGELGDNTAALRSEIVDDQLLWSALSAPDANATILGHTRWASVGVISEPNAHPLDSLEGESSAGPLVTAVLNGDVDNFADLSVEHGLGIAQEITTDAKVIPTLCSRSLAAGSDLIDAFRTTVASLDGSVAIGAASASHPGRVLFALRGSGQAIYVGLAADAFIIASEPYGVVELTSTYLRMDGETPGNPDNPTASQGQIVEVDAGLAGRLDGITRQAYDGTPLPLTESDLAVAQITTRDIDRGAYPHFLLKEITESPISFRKTLRGKLVRGADRLEVRLGDETVPQDIRAALRDGTISKVLVIGQGTAAIAGQSLAEALRSLISELPLAAEALPATELSGFRMRPDMSDTLIVAISQSGTTTDTNRTVDLVRQRGARVISIVNRRNSDLTDKSDGVLYTSDGRDVEMSVASTKAFYAQIAAGHLLATAIAVEAGAEPDEDHAQLLDDLARLPEAMERVVAERSSITEAAHRHAPRHRYWAIVGNGNNLIAARELRIKLSELCYKAIACDATEDKKHIDLSSEPLIFVCAAGLIGGNADDVGKEVAIYRAHKATPIVVLSESANPISSAVETLKVPDTHPSLGFVLTTMVGHLFGYEAALAIDSKAMPLRSARAEVLATVDVGLRGLELLDAIGPAIEPHLHRFHDGLKIGAYDGHMEAGTAVRIAGLLRYAARISPLETYQVEYGKVGTPSVVVEDLTAALTAGIEELTRPVDAIKHQAKTVTVGISRSDEALLTVRLVAEVLAAGAPRDRLGYQLLRTIAELDPTVEEVVGFTRYRLEYDPGSGDRHVDVIDRGGISLHLPLRTERNPVLRGTKRQVADMRQALIARGRSDGRTVLIVPEVKGTETVGLTLLHCRFPEHLPASVMRGALRGYRNRYSALRDAVLETEPSFDEQLFEQVPVIELLDAPVPVLAERWRT